jgi:ABC-2 type transport system permease protein
VVKAKLWAVIRREYLERVQTRAFLIGCLLGPVFITGIIFVPAWLSLRNLRADPASLIVIDATGAGIGDRLRRALDSASTTPNQPNKIDVRATAPEGIAAAESLATNAVVAKEYDGYVVLDASTVRGERARYAGRKATVVAEMRRLENALRQTSLTRRLENANLNPALVDSLTKSRLVLASERLTEQGRGSDASRRANVAFAAAVAFLLYMSMILYGQTVLRGVLEEKSTRVAEVVVSSVSPETLLAGKVIGVGAVGLTQQIIWVIATLYLGSFTAPILARMAPAVSSTGVQAPQIASMSLPDVQIASLVLILVFFILGYGVYSSLYAAVGATVNSEQEAQQALGPVLVLVIASALLIQPAMLNPTSTLTRVASMFPFSAPIIMPLRMSLVPIPPWEMAVAIGGLVVAFVAVIYIAARIYRVGLLMYGKRPTFGELARWVRQS